MPTIDGRWNAGHSKRRASGWKTAVPAESTRLEARGSRRRPGAGGSRARGRTARAPIPSGPSSHFWAATAYASAPVASKSTRIAPTLCAPSTAMRAPRAWASSANAATGRTAPVVQVTCEATTSRVSWRHRGLERREGRRVVAAVTDVDEVDLDARAVAERVERPERTRVLEAGRHGAVAGPPVDRRGDRVHAVGRGVGQRDRRRVGGEHRRHRRARLGHPLQRLGRSRRRGRGRRPARSWRARPSPPRSRPGAARPSRCSGRCRRRAPAGPPGRRPAVPRRAMNGATTAV